MKKTIKQVFSKFYFRVLPLALVVVICFAGGGRAFAGLLGNPAETTTKEIRERANAGLTGNYVEDTQAVVNSMRYAVNLPPNAADKKVAQADTRYKITAYASRYRRDSEKLGLISFTTLRTALNALASYYNGTTKRSVPEKVRDRVLVELDRVESALAQGR